MKEVLALLLATIVAWLFGIVLHDGPVREFFGVLPDWTPALFMFLPTIGIVARRSFAAKASVYANYDETSAFQWLGLNALVFAVFVPVFFAVILTETTLDSSISSSNGIYFWGTACYFLGVTYAMGRVDTGSAFRKLLGRRVSSDNDTPEPDHEATFQQAVHGEVLRLRRQSAFVLFLCIVVAVYAAVQAAQAIDVADTGGVSTGNLSEIRTRIEFRENELSRIVRPISPSDLSDPETESAVEANARRLEQKSAIESLLARDRELLSSELKRIEDERRRIDGPFLLSYFSSFFVRLASVLISLGFFWVLFQQYRRLDRQRAEFEVIRLSHKLLDTTEAKFTSLTEARSALAISDYVPTKRETDALSAFGLSTIGAVPSMMSEIGQNLTKLAGRTSEKNEEGRS